MSTRTCSTSESFPGTYNEFVSGTRITLSDVVATLEIGGPEREAGFTDPYFLV